MAVLVEFSIIQGWKLDCYSITILLYEKIATKITLLVYKRVTKRYKNSSAHVNPGFDGRVKVGKRENRDAIR